MFDKGKLRFELAAIEQIVTSSFSKGLISKIYKALSYSCTSSFESLKNVLEKDLGHEIEDTDWSEICNNLYSKCTSLGIHELNYKFINSLSHTFTSEKDLQKLLWSLF